MLIGLIMGFTACLWNCRVPAKLKSALIVQKQIFTTFIYLAGLENQPTLNVNG